MRNTARVPAASVTLVRRSAAANMCCRERIDNPRWLNRRPYLHSAGATPCGLARATLAPSPRPSGSDAVQGTAQRPRKPTCRLPSGKKQIFFNFSAAAGWAEREEVGPQGGVKRRH
eukprot:scaffold31964_cov129-Isochrysis_galbana.AAC.2